MICQIYDIPGFLIYIKILMKSVWPFKGKMYCFQTRDGIISLFFFKRDESLEIRTPRVRIQTEPLENWITKV